MRSLAMVRVSPLGIRTAAAVWASTSAISTVTQSLVDTAKADYSDLHSRGCWRIDCVTSVPLLRKVQDKRGFVERIRSRWSLAAIAFRIRRLTLERIASRR